MPGVARTEVTTTDEEAARELLGTAYTDSRMRFSGSTGAPLVTQVRYDLGPVRLDAVRHTLTIDYESRPFDCLQIVRPLDHTIMYETGGDPRHFGPGEVFLAAQPGTPFRARNEQLRLQTVGLDLSLVAEVTGAPPLAVVRRFLPGALPVARAEFWQRAVSYATTTLTGPGAEAPLVLDGVRRLLAGAAVTAFDPEVEFDLPRDRGDATPVAVRLAVAHLETNPDLELSAADVARAAHVSVRALQLAFRKHLDTTPMAYLRRVRMDRVRADLSAADPGRTTVTEVTARWGFPAVGRFSADYLTAYGEHPRDTLRRR